MRGSPTHLSRRCLGIALVVTLLNLLACGQSPTSPPSTPPRLILPPPTATSRPAPLPGCGGFGPPELVARFRTSGHLEATASADFNADGMADILLTRIIWRSAETFEPVFLLNRGGGQFVNGNPMIFHGAPPRTHHPRQIVVADFNGDGRPDIFLADHGQDAEPFPGYQNTLILSTPEGKFVDATANLPQRSDFTHSAAAGDVDLDGDWDLYVGNIWGRKEIPPYVLLNDGSGAFSLASGLLPDSVSNLNTSRFTASVFADVNNDRAPDLILGADDHTPASLVLLNDGLGHFSLKANAIPIKPYAATDIALVIEPVELNGDGYIDLVMAFTQADYQNRYLQVLVNQGDATFADETTTRLEGFEPQGTWIKELEVVDFDGNGSPDILTKHVPGSGEQPLLLLNNGTGRFSTAPLGVNIQANLFSLVDLDGDGGLDILSSVPASGGQPETHFLIRDQRCP